MSREKYDKIVEKAYKNYHSLFDSYYPPFSAPYPKRLTKEEFVNNCRTDKQFCKEYEFSIEERDMTWEEQVKWVMKNRDIEWENLYIVEEVAKPTTPTKIILATYKNETTEVYE